MDSFGRLPTDVIDKITSLYNTAKIEFIDHGDQQIEMVMTGVPYSINFNIMTPLCNVDGVVKCQKYLLREIKDLIDNKKGMHLIAWDDHKIFGIIIDDIITIKTQDFCITIPIIYIDVLICGLQQYYNLLDKYPKY